MTDKGAGEEAQMAIAEVAGYGTESKMCDFDNEHGVPVHIPARTPAKISQVEKRLMTAG